MLAVPGIPAPLPASGALVLPAPGPACTRPCPHFLLPLAPPRSTEHSRDTPARPGPAGCPPFGEPLGHRCHFSSKGEGRQPRAPAPPEPPQVSSQRGTGVGTPHPGACFTHRPGMRTPTAMIVGMVLCPCGMLLTFVGTLTPNWRQVSHMSNQPVDFVLEQGIWDICREQQSIHDRRCGQADALGYFEQVPVRVAQGMMPTSLALTLLGLVVAALGVRCWQPEPRHLLAGVSGLMLLLSGLLGLIPASWYTHELWALPAPDGGMLVAGYSLVLSYLGSCMEILGGLALTLSFHHCCEERRAPKLPPSSSLDAGPWSTTTDYYSRWNVQREQRDTQDQRSTLPCDSDL